MIAGLTVAMVAIPQSMAYAQLASLPPIYGLYAVIFPAIIGAAFGSSSHLITGASNATALATAGVLAAFVLLPEYPEYAFVMAILTGLIRLGMGLLRLGGIMRYVSNSVLTGLLAAVGVLIIINQTPNLIGIARPANADTIGVLHAIITGLPEINPYVLATGLVSMVVLILSRKISKNIPAAMLAIIVAGALVYVTGWHLQGVRIVSDLSNLNKVGVSFHIPNVPLEVIPQLLPGALALAFFSLMEAINISKAISMNTDQPINTSREFVGQGMASLVGGFFQSFPSSGSPARTTVNFTSGAVTRLSGIFSGLFIWLALTVFTRLIGYIPISSLAGVVIVSAVGVFNGPHLRLTWQSRDISRLVMVTTFVSTLLLPLHYAIYVGVALTILIYLFESSHLRMSYLTLNDEGLFVENSIESVQQIHPRVALINVEGALYFGAADDLEKQIIRTFNAGVKVIILRLRRVHLMASTGVTAMQHVVKQAEKMGIRVVLCGINADIEHVLKDSGLLHQIGPERTFLASQTLFASTCQAVEAARDYVDQEPSFSGEGMLRNLTQGIQALQPNRGLPGTSGMGKGSQ